MAQELHTTCQTNLRVPLALRTSEGTGFTDAAREVVIGSLCLKKILQEHKACGHAQSGGACEKLGSLLSSRVDWVPVPIPMTSLTQCSWSPSLTWRHFLCLGKGANCVEGRCKVAENKEIGV